MADRDPSDVLRENAYLKLRNAQLQSDILDLSAEVERLRRIQDRLHVRTMAQKPDMPTGAELGSPRNHVGQKVPTRSDVTPVHAPADSASEEAVVENGVMTRFGITRTPGDYFHVGDYRYTSLKDAVVQAKRQSNVP